MASERPNSRFDRRQFARVASSGLALFVIPGWFAACARTERRAGGDIGAAGRAKLVLHVPEDAGWRWKIGAAFGVFLLRASDEQVAPLASCELGCATTAELEKLGLDVEGVHAVLLVPDGEPVVVWSGEFPENPYSEWEESKSTELFRKQHAWIAEQLARKLGPGSAAFERELRLERAACGELGPDEAPSLQRATDAPGLALQRAALDPRTRTEWLALIAESLRARWHDEAPAGSSWAVTHGCGLEIERPIAKENFAVDCGMGFTPELGARFLHLFSSEELRGG